MKNKMVANFFTAVSALGLAVSTPALAAQAVTLDSDVKVERTVNNDGVEAQVLSEPVDVVPGDKLVFQTNYANNSAETVENFVVTNPLPDAVMLVSQDGSFDISIDGGATYVSDLSGLTVEDAGTDLGTRPANLADVTHIRWTLARLEPGARGSLSYQAIVR